MVLFEAGGGLLALTDADPYAQPRTRFTNLLVQRSRAMPRFIDDTMRSPWSAQVLSGSAPSAAGRRDLLRGGNRWSALRLLAKSVDGHTEPYLFARGISKVLLAGLLRDGLATQSKARAGD
jgi:hypothetical protein